MIEYPDTLTALLQESIIELRLAHRSWVSTSPGWIDDAEYLYHREAYRSLSNILFVKERPQ